MQKIWLRIFFWFLLPFFYNNQNDVLYRGVIINHLKELLTTMDKYRAINFNQELQWGKEMASSYVAAVCNLIVREEKVKVESICETPQTKSNIDDYIKREDDIQNCYDLCALFRSMGYVAYINKSRTDGFPVTVTIYNLPFTPALLSICHTYRVLYFQYITPEKDRAKIERWEDINTVPNNSKDYKPEFENTQTSYTFEKFELEDFGYLTMDLQHCDSYKCAYDLSVMCTIKISSKIEEVLNQYYEGKSKEEQLKLYADALNNGNVMCPERRNINSQINIAIDDEGLLTPLPYINAEKWKNDKALNKITKSQSFINYVISRANICPQLYLDHQPKLGEHTLVLCHKLYGYDGTNDIDDYEIKPLTQLEKDKGLLQIVRDYFKTDGPYTKFADWDIIL